MIKLNNVTTGIISDLQIPGNIDTALEFVLDVGSDYKVKQWVQIGDLIDHHYISRHPNETDARNPIDEVVATRKELAKWVKAFPNMFICRGNHDMIPNWRASSLGIPELFMRSINDVYDLPNSWRWEDKYYIFDRTLIDHGMGSNGMYGAKNTANKLGCSYIQGHTHAHGAVFDIPRPFGNCAALNVGCLMDEEKYNARYAKYFFKLPVSLGMGIAQADDEMYFVKYKE